MIGKTLGAVLSLAGLGHGMLVGPLTITENGSPTTRYAVSTWADGISVSGSSITLPHNSGVQIASEGDDDYSNPYMFVGYNLDGATLSFTADYSSISCSCNGALYFVTMPALDDSGNPTGGTDGDYYCDANDVNGELCWELDIMEANMYVSATTPHSCDQSPGQPTYSCDGGGCGTNSYNENGSGFCPDSSCTINTQSPFDFSISFSSSDYHVKFSQNGQTFEFDVCGDSGYLSNFQQALDYGMVLILSSWGDDYNEMSWLDSMTGCTGDCDTSGYVTWSNISISSSSGGPVTVEQSKWKPVSINGTKGYVPAALSEAENSIPGHTFEVREGKYGTKAKWSVPV